MNIVLIGFMGTGKTQVGRVMAQRLEWDFYDTDEMIEKQTGLTVAEIFAKAGETAFREMEKATIKMLSLLDRVVVSTGGGVPLREENMRELSRNGHVIHLSATPQTIYNRLKNEIDKRPLLQGPDPFHAIESLLTSRRHAYARSQQTVHTDNLSPEQVADHVLSLIEKVPLS